MPSRSKPPSYMPGQRKALFSLLRTKRTACLQDFVCLCLNAPNIKEDGRCMLASHGEICLWLCSLDDVVILCIEDRQCSCLDRMASRFKYDPMLQKHCLSFKAHQRCIYQDNSFLYVGHTDSSKMVNKKRKTVNIQMLRSNSLHSSNEYWTCHYADHFPQTQSRRSFVPWSYISRIMHP